MKVWQIFVIIFGVSRFASCFPSRPVFEAVLLKNLPGALNIVNDYVVQKFCWGSNKLPNEWAYDWETYYHIWCYKFLQLVRFSRNKTLCWFEKSQNLLVLALGTFLLMFRTCSRLRQRKQLQIPRFLFYSRSRLISISHNSISRILEFFAHQALWPAHMSGKFFLQQERRTISSAKLKKLSKLP